jgi:steroid 5-alpha reductase family enzyme
MLKTTKQKVALAAVLSVAAASSHAALPEAATNAITSIQTDGVAMIDAFWPVAVAITGGFVILKLFRKGVGKAT